MEPSYDNHLAQREYWRDLENEPADECGICAAECHGVNSEYYGELCCEECHTRGMELGSVLETYESLFRALPASMPEWERDNMRAAVDAAKQTVLELTGEA